VAARKLNNVLVHDESFGGGELQGHSVTVESSFRKGCCGTRATGTEASPYSRFGLSRLSAEGSTMSSLPLAPVSHRRRILLALVSGAIGCGGTGPTCGVPVEDDSLYILCQGHDHLYWINNRGQQTDQINVCVPETYLNETGAAGTEGEIDLEEWVNDTEDLEFLRTLCVAQCKTATWKDAESQCEPYNDTANEFVWEVENYLGQPTPDPLMNIAEPWRLTCASSSASALLANAPWETFVVPAAGPVWPGTQDTVSVACGDFGGCADLFTAPIGEVLYHDDSATLWGADMGYADYLATTSTASSQLEITILNPGGAPARIHTTSMGASSTRPPTAVTPNAPSILQT
jgi:hypothetical protein